ncbi:RidA family protein [Spirosoma panaciterrae]|uniref:RidA family protein n=1 Tax=Spirosoma panaciterrae TaxID=496058 RepID=UPI0003675B91|nr:RidA family protein [Spirosoma panaciterrae]
MRLQRHSLFNTLFASAASLAGLAVSTPGLASAEPAEPREADEATHQDVPLYSSRTKLDNLVFIFGIGAHFEGDIKAHTDHVLREMATELAKAGSSMEKVLKVNVYLHDLTDYKSMNEVFKGRFGAKPPVRTTVAPRAGVPGNSLIEMDCIAYV